MENNLYKYRQNNFGETVTVEDNIELGNHFIITPVPTRLLHSLSQYQPGIFIEGGTARNIALEVLLGITPDKIPQTLDVDLLTLERPRIYTGSNTTCSSRRTATQGDSVSERLLVYLGKRDFTLNQALLGRVSKYQEPTLYVTPQAYDDYTNRIIRVSQDSDKTDDKGMILPRLAVRNLLFLGILSQFGFRSIQSFESIGQTIKKHWHDKEFQKLLKEYYVRALKLGCKNEFIKYFRSFGFTVPTYA